MSSSAQLTSKHLEENIEDEKKSDKGAGEVQGQVDGEEVLVPENTSSVPSTVLNTINNESEHDGLEVAVRLFNPHQIPQSTEDHVPGHKNSGPGLPGTKFLVRQVWAIWFIVSRWVWDADMPGALVADEMGLGKTFTTVAAAMICKLPTENIVMGLPLSILWGNTLAEWVNMVQKDFPRIIGEEREWYLLRRHHPVPRRLIEFQNTPPQWHPALTSALESILVVILPGVAETVMSVIDEMTDATDFTLLNLFRAEHANLTHKDLTTRLDEP